MPPQFNGLSLLTSANSRHKSVLHDYLGYCKLTNRYTTGCCRSHWPSAFIIGLNLDYVRYRAFWEVLRQSGPTGIFSFPNKPPSFLHKNSWPSSHCFKNPFFSVFKTLMEIEARRGKRKEWVTVGLNTWGSIYNYVHKAFGPTNILDSGLS